MRLYDTFCYYKHILYLKRFSSALFCTISKKKVVFLLLLRNIY